MAIRHAISGQAVNVRPLGAKLIETESTALVTDEHLLVIRMVFLEGDGLPEHRLRGPVTVQCLEGRVEIVADQVTTILEGGDMVYLAADSPRSLRARTDASLLVSLFRTAHHGADNAHFAQDYTQLTGAPWPALGDPAMP